MLAGVGVFVAARWGQVLLADGHRYKLHGPPFRGPVEWRPGPRTLPAVGVGLAAIMWLPRAGTTMRWPNVLVWVFAVSIAWALALALIDGPSAITDPLVHRSQYLQTVDGVSDLGGFLRHFTDRIAGYNVHTQGHPPGMIVVLVALRALGWGGRSGNAALVFGGGAAAMVATLVTVRDVAGEGIARRAAPFLALTPAAIWWSSGDAFFAGVGAVAVMFVVLALGRGGRPSDRFAVAGGILFAATAFLSYGLVLLAAIPVAVAWTRRRFRPLVIAGATATMVMLLVAIGTGFAWWEGLAATRTQYFAGVGAIRPYGYFLLANLAVFAVMIGPAGVAGLGGRLRPRAFAMLVAGGVAAVLVADFSGMSKAEVERIWIPFVPWVVVAAAAVAPRAVATRLWLGTQVATALLVAVWIRSPW